MTAIVRGEDAPRFGATGGTRIIGYAAPSRGSKELATWRMLLDPGVASPAHTHDREEVLHVVHGSLRAEVDGESHELREGDTLIIPAGTLHQMFHPADDGVVEG